MLEGHTLGLEAERQNGGQTVHARGDGFQPHRAVVDGVEARHVGQQHLSSTDVRVGLSRRMCCSRVCIAMRSAACRGHPGDTDDAARHGALVGVAGGEEGGVRATVTHGHAKALGRAQHHVGPSSPGDLSSSKESRSALTQASPFWACTAAIRARRSFTSPVVVGY